MAGVLAVGLSLAATGNSSAETSTKVVVQKISSYPVPIGAWANFSDGSKTYCIVDTGAAHCLFPPQLQRSLGRPLGVQNFEALNGQGKLQSFEGTPLRLGPFDLGTHQVGVLDLSSIYQITGMRDVAVLGSDVLHSLALEIDRQKGEAKFYEPTDTPPGMAALEMDMSQGVPILSLELSNLKLPFLLDLGFMGEGVNLTSTAFASLVEKGWIKEGVTGHDNSPVGFKQSRSGAFTQGKMLGLDLAGVSVGGTGDYNVVGLSFLHCLHVIVDFKHSKLYYEPLPIERPADPFSTLGAYVVFKDDVAVVVLLKPKGRAERAGLRAGDRLTRLGVLKRNGFNLEMLYAMCAQYKNKKLPFTAERDGATEPVKGQIDLASEK